MTSRPLIVSRLPRAAALTLGFAALMLVPLAPARAQVAGVVGARTVAAARETRVGEATMRARGDTAPVAVAAAESRLTTGARGGDAIEAATRAYRERGTVPPPVTVGGVVVFPFGHGEPVLTCTVLRACVVELEAGEILVNEPIAGDQARWIIDQAKTGPQGANALVVVKPKACDITTNLVLSTDRRIYDLDLDSPACNERSTNPKRSYVRHVRFYYPDADTAAAAPAGDGRPVAQRDRTATPAVNAARSATRATNRDYRIVRKRRGPLGLFGKKPLDFPWQPAAIVDDGAHVYITLPIRALYDAAPVLYALEAHPSLRARLAACCDEDDPEVAAEVADAVVASGAAERARRDAVAETEQALAALGAVEGPYVEALALIARELSRRES